MAKEVASLIVGIILILAGAGYAFQLVNGTVDSSLTLLFLLQILIIYIFVKDIKFK